MPIAETENTVTAAPFFGGDYSTGPALGDYHTIVTDAGFGTSKTGRGNLQIELTVKDDPNHPGKEGKKLTRMFISLPLATDDGDKQKTMKGMIKRQLDGFGVAWPKEVKNDFKPQTLIGKQAWVRLDVDKNDTEGRAKVMAVAQTHEALPLKKGAGTPAKSTPAANGRRR